MSKDSIDGDILTQCKGAKSKNNKTIINLTLHNMIRNNIL